MKKLLKSRSVRQLDEIIFSSGVSRVTMPDKLNEIVQYHGNYISSYIVANYKELRDLVRI